MIYKMMGSNIFINHALFGMRASYKVLGVSLTNWFIEKTCGTIFTGGVTLEDLSRSAEELERQNIGTIGMAVVEGLSHVSEEKLDEFLAFSLKSVDMFTDGRTEGHLAVKLTAFVSTEVMEKVSTAQRSFVEKILQVPFDGSDAELSQVQLRENLAGLGIENYSQTDFEALVNSVSDSEGKMTAVYRYAGGHLFSLYNGRNALQEQIAVKCGGMNAADFVRLNFFVKRMEKLTAHA